MTGVVTSEQLAVSTVLSHRYEVVFDFVACACGVLLSDWDRYSVHLINEFRAAGLEIVDAGTSGR